MDLKGITWVGNVYQKFEAMCLEVEEVMYQDTVKYVENQVQTVGASVKKFYSEVMHDVMYDFLPPCSMDPVKAVSASDLPTEKDAGKYKKARIGLKEDTFKVDSKQQTQYSDVTADVTEDTSHDSSFPGLHSVDNSYESSPARFVKGYYLSSVKRRNRSVHNKSNQECLLMSAISPETTYLKEELCRSSFQENTKANCGASHHQIPATSTAVSAEADGSTFIEGSRHEIENASESIPGTSNYDLPLVESIGKRELDTRCSSYCGVSAEPNGADGLSNDTMVSLPESSIDGDMNCNKPCDEVVLTSHPGELKDWTINTMESTTVPQQGIESIQQLNKIDVEESCIMVSGSELHFVPKEGKRRLYKKKIRDAISSRMRSSRKKEYEQLAMLHGNDAESEKGSLMPTLSRNDAGISPNNDLLESEWELL
ncbi:hypothetical protein SLA2020_050310 [Shorea laevis]